MAEYAFALWLGVPWSGERVLHGDEQREMFSDEWSDVSGFEIRATHYRSGKLIYRPGSGKPTKPYVLAITSGRRFTFAGWLYGSECVSIGDRRGESFWVEQSNLHPMQAIMDDWRRVVEGEWYEDE